MGTSSHRLRLASIIGTTLEYFDFAVYNTLAALIFSQIFFPSFDPATGTILAFSTFAVVRPHSTFIRGRTPSPGSLEAAIRPFFRFGAPSAVLTVT